MFCPVIIIKKKSLKVKLLLFLGAFSRPCECSDTGSLSKKCDTYYGGCDCKGLMVNRRCDACAPASYGFSSQGCRRCDCTESWNPGSADHGAGHRVTNQWCGAGGCDQHPVLDRLLLWDSKVDLISYSSSYDQQGHVCWR